MNKTPELDTDAMNHYFLSDINTLKILEEGELSSVKLQLIESILVDSFASDRCLVDNEFKTILKNIGFISSALSKLVRLIDYFKKYENSDDKKVSTTIKASKHNSDKGYNKRDSDALKIKSP